MEILIKQNNLKVLTTNSIIVPEGYETTINLGDEFHISIIFMEGNKQEIKKENVGDNGIKITLVAFNNYLGTSTTKPIAIAQNGNNTIYISLCAYAINKVKMLTYTLLSEV